VSGEPFAGAPADPIAFFADWYAAAEAAGDEAHVAVLATADGDGRPAARAVLLKEHGPAGLGFVTDSRSRKAADLAANPRGALLFLWRKSDRQVRVEGAVEPVADDLVEAWWVARPRMSRLAATISEQSHEIASRADLVAALQAADAAAPAEPPRPEHFVGLRVVPDRVEFWQEGAARLHHRLAYARADEGWRRALLAP
jgi:pyridoxamine 5'-phosphate oxidase